MRAVIIIALCLAAVAAVPSNPQRIIGGTLTTINQYPTIASLLYSWNLSTYVQSCGGSILNNRSILSAAHCTIDGPANRWRVRVGSSWANSGGVVHNSAQIFNHPDFGGWNFDNDVCIIRLATMINFGNTVQSASIAGPNYNVADNQVVWAAGWGITSVGGPASEQLRHVQIWTINQNTCAQRYGSVGNTVNANMLCSGWLDVGGRDHCQGDSGGPLYHNGIVVGVRSWGVGCAEPFFPGVNARVSRYTAWIQANA